MARYYRISFAATGDRTDLPDTTPDSAVSYQTGYTREYELNSQTNDDARFVERNIFNDLVFDLTSNEKLYYETAYPPYITDAMNGGTPYQYDQYARCRFNNRVYESLTDNNATEPTDTSNWRLVDSAGMDARYYPRSTADSRFLQVSNNLSDIDSASTSRTNLGLGTAATTNTGTSTTKHLSLIHI